MNGLDELKAKRDAIYASLAADLVALATYKVECSRIVSAVVQKEKALEEANARILGIN